MNGWAFVAVVILATLTGSSVAVLTDWVRTESRRLNRDLAAINAQIDADRARPYNQDAP